MPLHVSRSARIPPPATDGWRHEMFLKADFFSRTDKGCFTVNGSEVPAVRRDVRYARWWTRPLAVLLADRERRALRRLLGVPHTPDLLLDARWTIVRSWIDGVPLREAQPRDPAFYSSARRLLAALRRAGVVHNDLAKEQNWLVTANGDPALIDFQLASVRRSGSRLSRLMAREDLRHLLKHKRTYCPEHLSASEHRLLATPSLPSRIWRQTGKRVYNFVTRRIFRWRDGEGQGELAA